MITDTLLERLSESKKHCDEARNAMSKTKWRNAEEELNFWQGKASFYTSQLEKETRSMAIVCLKKQG